jgi:hypothetical protein
MKKLNNTEKTLIKVGKNKKLRILKKYFNRFVGSIDRFYYVLSFIDNPLKKGDVIGTCAKLNETIDKVYKNYYGYFLVDIDFVTKERFACGGQVSLNHCVSDVPYSYDDCFKRHMRFLTFVINLGDEDMEKANTLKELLENGKLLHENGIVKEEYLNLYREIR